MLLIFAYDMCEINFENEYFLMPDETNEKNGLQNR